MKLEVGKTYRARNGEIVTIKEYHKGVIFPFKGDDDNLYSLTGAYHFTKHNLDLIEEVPPAPSDSPSVPELKEFDEWDTTIGQKQRREENFEPGSVTLRKRMEQNMKEFGTGFPQNAEKLGGVLVSTAAHTVRTETSAVKAASADAVKAIKEAFDKELIPKEYQVSPEFKVGDKVFDILDGKVYTLIGVESHGFSFVAGKNSLDRYGRWLKEHKYPRYISLADAKAKGYDVPVQKVKKSKTMVVVYVPSLNIKMLRTDSQLTMPLPPDAITKEVTFEWVENE